ncbi:stalk domain-containing protein [Paenibacillus wulumuqiensis]|uniref:stalk domain-containing protein n=1 Tax=Paenibacillus wulumuqiensis TaxID=1567107 RepID=UPI0006986EE5|nr:stalk domain-containing protein [Paenibacillus wulumuqiensis]
MKKGIASLLVGSALLIGTGTGALAATNMEEVTAYLNDQIKVEVDGNPATLQTANGKAVTPLTYNGTTYLPVRATAELMGANVVYNAATSTVQLTTTTGNTYAGTTTSGGSTTSGSTDTTGTTGTTTDTTTGTTSNAGTTGTSTDTTGTTNPFTETTNSGTVNSNGGTVDSTTGGEVSSPASGTTVDTTTGGSTNPSQDNDTTGNDD